MKISYPDNHTLVSSQRKLVGAFIWLVVTVALACGAVLGYNGSLPEVGRWGAFAVALLALRSAWAAANAYEHKRITVDTSGRWLRVYEMSEGSSLEVGSELKNLNGVRVCEFRDSKGQPEFQVFLVRDGVRLPVTGYGGAELLEKGRQIHAWLVERGVNADFQGPEQAEGACA